MSREMTASVRRRPSSPAAGPLEDDDLLAEILLRLPPLPSSLPRASAVSRRWRSLASDPRFSRRFRGHHRRNAPLLGCFIFDFHDIHFEPALEAPNRVPEGRFSFPVDSGERFMPFGCRHGLVLSLTFHDPGNQLLVWDPLIGDLHRLDLPPGFDTEQQPFSGTVLRADGDIQHFEVVLLGISNMQQAVACVYSSKTGVWGNLTTTPLPRGDSSGMLTWVYPDMPAVMVGDSVHCLVVGNSAGILEFGLDKRSLGFIPMPGEETLTGGTVHGDNFVLRGGDMGHGDIFVLREGGGLAFLFLSGFNAQLWKRKTNCADVASWVLESTIALDKLLSINPEETPSPSILGFAEDNNVVLLWTSIGIFTVQLESLQFKTLFESSCYDSYYPFEGVYTAEKGIDGGHDGAELL